MPQSRTLLLLCAAWLLHNVCAFPRSILKQKSLATKGSLLSYWSTGDPENQAVVVPNLKLLICAVPKNACTQFKMIAKAIGVDDKDKHDMNAIFKDPSWTKAVFLRDPLERLISGYRSKCEPPMEGHGGNCMNFEDSTPQSWPSFDQFASELHRCHNPHFDPQVSFCSLGTKFDSYNFVGQITSDNQAVAVQVRQLFNQAANRSGSVTKANHQNLAEMSEKYFPSGGPTKGRLSHFHNDTDVRAYFRETTTLDAALQRYIVDYDRLPLEPPAWVTKDQLNRARDRALAALPARGEEDPRFACRSHI